jgi:glucose/arabinose dehydrogenase
MPTRLAFHPGYAANGFFFVNYTDKSIDTVIARYRVSTDDPDVADPSSGRVLLKIDQPFTNHNGGQLQFGPDGYLYVGMGDGGSGGDPDCRAQRGDTLLGKLLRIDVDQSVSASPFYGIPPDNPFRGNDGIPDEVWARGLRNPWRFSFDRGTGDLYIGDVGQSAREEVDRQSAGSPGGENYGWKVMEGSLCFGTASCPASTPACNSPALTVPILEYQNDGHDCSVIGGYVYRGDRLPQLRGTYLFGDLCSGKVWGAKARQDGTWEVRRLADADTLLEGQSLIAFGEDRRGEIYVVTNDALYRLDTSGQGSQGGDGVGLFDPATVTFRIKTALSSGPADLTFRFGRRGKGWIPVVGDWNGDGHDTVGYWDPGTKSFRLRSSLTPGSADLRFFLPQARPGWVPLVGDWNGDGRDGIGFYDPATSTFRIKNVLRPGGFGLAFRFGSPGPGVAPVVGDWDGDGRDTVGLFDPQTDTFRLRNSLSEGAPDVRYEFGNLAGIVPLVGDWDGDGVDTPGFYLRDVANFALTGRTGVTLDTVFQFGEPGGSQAMQVPLAGHW